ncbi:hypothetical protein [Citrobacter arsenatis]|uniref:hypothetical protein n=1 Tax=Citrobacter arsenatis TaxID=2546350 RepID=UPI00300E5CC8
MPSLDEAAAQVGSQLESVLHSAVKTISSDQQITFRLYVRQVLPLDGFVYWINAAIVPKEELERLQLSMIAVSRVVQGSLHRQVVTEQNDVTSRDVNSIIFTPTAQEDDFNVESPEAIYLGEFDGTQFAFSRMESKYTQAGIFHYRGRAVLPTMRTQIIDATEDIPDKLIISNSVPIWLSMKQFATVYPSYLSPSNLKPPYIVADVKTTTPLQMAPNYYCRYQHVQDSVRVTLFGFDNQRALEFVDYVVRRALNMEEYGITNMPVVTDGKAGQVEIGVLAQLKYIDFDINYYQATTRDIAEKLIKKAVINYEVK